MAKKLSEIGEEVYQKNKEWLEKGYMDKIVALCEDGVAGIGDTLDEVYEQALKKYPKKAFYFRRVGPCPTVVHMFGLIT